MKHMAKNGPATATLGSQGSPGTLAIPLSLVFLSPLKAKVTEGAEASSRGVKAPGPVLAGAEHGWAALASPAMGLVLVSRCQAWTQRVAEPRTPAGPPTRGPLPL